MRSIREAALLFIATCVIVTPAILLAHGPTPVDSQGALPEVLSTQLVVSYLLVWLQDALKRAKSVPVIQYGARNANIVLAWVFAVAQAIGIGYTFDTATGTLIVTGLSLASVVEVGRAYVVQKLFYKVAFSRGGVA